MMSTTNLLTYNSRVLKYPDTTNDTVVLARTAIVWLKIISALLLTVVALLSVTAYYIKVAADDIDTTFQHGNNLMKEFDDTRTLFAVKTAILNFPVQNNTALTLRSVVEGTINALQTVNFSKVVYDAGLTMNQMTKVANHMIQQYSLLSNSDPVLLE